MSLKEPDHPPHAPAAAGWTEPKTTAVLVLADGTVLEGQGFGATGTAPGEVCFNTAMTGYEEILTDPSYAGQIVTFTFPHIGNVGTNDEDIEALNLAATPGARGAVVQASVTEPSNYRSALNLDAWLKRRNIIGLSGIDIAHFWLTLILLGLGWNFGFVGASALVLECHRAEEKDQVQSANDFIVFGSVAFGSLLSGIVLTSYGWNAVLWASLLPLALAAFVLARAKAGRETSTQGY